MGPCKRYCSLDPGVAIAGNSYELACVKLLDTMGGRRTKKLIIRHHPHGSHWCTHSSQVLSSADKWWHQWVVQCRCSSAAALRSPERKRGEEKEEERGGEGVLKWESVQSKKLCVRCSFPSGHQWHSRDLALSGLGYRVQVTWMQVRAHSSAHPQHKLEI